MSGFHKMYGRGLAEKFVRRAVTSGVETVAMLLRLTFMESQGRYEMFTAHPPALILPFSRRFSCNEHLFESNPFGGQVAYAWYVWRRGEINTGVKWIDSSAAHSEWLGSKKEKLTW